MYLENYTEIDAFFSDIFKKTNFNRRNIFDKTGDSNWKKWNFYQWNSYIKITKNIPLFVWNISFKIS